MLKRRHAATHISPSGISAALSLSLFVSLSLACSDHISTIPDGGAGAGATEGGGTGGADSASAAQTGGGGEMGPIEPNTMDHRTEVKFTGHEIECKFGFIPVPYQVPDCATTMTTTITTKESGDVCNACDGTYHGPFTYLEDTCSELAGDEAPATEGSFGFQFNSETARELWGQNEELTWEKSMDLAKDASGAWTGTVTDDLILDSPDCNNGVQNLGTFKVTVFFTDVD
jgi:hypothetical protein